jgi:hypothetical protein
MPMQGTFFKKHAILKSPQTGRLGYGVGLFCPGWVVDLGRGIGVSF